MNSIYYISILTIIILISCTTPRENDVERFGLLKRMVNVHKINFKCGRMHLSNQIGALKDFFTLKWGW